MMRVLIVLLLVAACGGNSDSGRTLHLGGFDVGEQDWRDIVKEEFTECAPFNTATRAQWIKAYSEGEPQADNILRGDERVTFVAGQRANPTDAELAVDIILAHCD